LRFINDKRLKRLVLQKRLARNHLSNVSNATTIQARLEHKTLQKPLVSKRSQSGGQLLRSSLQVLARLLSSSASTAFAVLRGWLFGSAKISCVCQAKNVRRNIPTPS